MRGRCWRVGSLDLTPSQWSRRYEIALPDGYGVERLPEGRRRSNAAGSYTSAYGRGAEGRIVVERRLQLAKDVYQPDEYPALRELLYDFDHDFRATIVLERAPAP